MQSSMDYTGVLFWKGFSDNHLLNFTYSNSGLEQSVRGRKWDLNRTAAFTNCSRASKQQTQGTEKHIGRVWCLLSHLKNTSSCTRLEKIDINSRSGREKGEPVSCTAMRIYPCFSTLSFQTSYVYTFILSSTFFLNSPSVLLPSFKPKNTYIAIRKSGPTAVIQSKLFKHFTAVILVSQPQPPLYFVHQLWNIILSLFQVIQPWQTFKSLGYRISNYQTIWADCTHDKGWSVKTSCSQCLEKLTWHLPSCLDSNPPSPFCI